MHFGSCTAHSRGRERLVAWAAMAALAACTRAALAGPEENLEERFDEARTSPTPVVKRGSWVVVPIPVSNPTVGTGLNLSVLYLHAKAEGDESPAATSGAAAMATDGGARLVGGFHDSSLYDDHLRISAFAGVGEFHLKYYGVADDPLFSRNPLPYKLEGTLAQLRGEVRIPGTEHWFGGATYQYLDATFTPDTSEIAPGFSDTPHHFRSAAFGPHVTFDSRDSNYYPRSGQRFRAGWLNYGPRWGGDFSFDKIDVFYNHYLPFGRTSVLGLRARMQDASESTPFLFLPTLDMRGFSRDRYRDNRTVSLTAEWRQMLLPRWGYAAYAETGRYAASVQALKDSRTITTVGAGIRWQATADRDLNVGLDFAVSTDDRAVFIQVGERF
jgi:hypothetical protein